jgi:hypothetical protein
LSIVVLVELLLDKIPTKIVRKINVGIFILIILI